MSYDADYICMWCKRPIKKEELVIGIRCPNCNYRILKKVRKRITKDIKAV